ncbi:hypothetical protein SB758_35305, partial [Burkholderia sp. SIMBA_013]
MTDKQAEALIACDWRRLKLAMTWGRPMPRVLSVVEKMSQISGSPESSIEVKPRDALVGIRLEDMEGYG